MKSFETEIDNKVILFKLVGNSNKRNVFTITVDNIPTGECIATPETFTEQQVIEGFYQLRVNA